MEVLIIIAIFIPFLGGAFIAYQYFEIKKEKQNSDKRIETLEKEIQEAWAALQQMESELIRSQIEKLNYELSPHAFKNTLHSLRSLSRRTDQSIEKLGALLDYMLYDTNKNYVSLDQEIEFLKDFITLHELMLPPYIKIRTDFEGVNPYWAKQVKIAPLITVYFAENAFKHTANDVPGEIIFSIKQGGADWLLYQVINPVPRAGAANQRSGIGKSNLSKRLDLLYKNQHKFESGEQGGKYIAKLELIIELS